MNSYYLVVMVGLPIVAAAGVAAMPRGREELAKQVSLAVSLVVLLFACLAAAAFHTHGPRFQLTMSVPWIPDFGTSFALGVDGIAVAMLLLTSVLTPIVILASWRDTAPGNRSLTAYFAWVLLLEGLMVGVFAATDVFLFYVFFEVMLVPMYFIIGGFGGPRRQYAAMKFFIYNLVGGLVMLAAVIGLYVVSSQHLAAGTFAFDALNRLVIDQGAQKLLFLGFFIAFAIKAPLVPLHTWLPDAGAEAPAGGAVLMLGIMDKVGTFGFLRYCLPLFPDASRDFAPWILVLAVIGILYAALLCMGQRDMKRLVSYTSVSHFGFIALGIFTFTTEGATGAVAYMVNHGLVIGLLFLVVGMLIARGGSRLVRDYGGVASYAPLLAGAMLVATMATLSLPGTNSFVSEFLTLIGSFPVKPVYAIFAAVGILLSAIYILLMFQRTMTGPPRGVLLTTEPVAADEPEPVPSGDSALVTATLVKPAPAKPRLRIRDLSRREIAVVTPLIALIIALGFYQQPLLDLVRPSVAATISDVGGHAQGIVPVHPGASAAGASTNGGK